MKLNVRTLIVNLVLAVAALVALRPVYAASARAIDQQAQAALDSLYVSSPAAKALGANAKAVLVFPDIRKAAFIVGAQSGEGVLFRNAKATRHFRADGVLAGLEAGAQSYAYALFFMSDGALRNLRAAKGFQIGVDPNIVIIDAGAGKEISTTTAQADVYSYVFDQKGLMGGVALQGLKITRTKR
jgi:lipid-binding SYLF domain-containing protein